ncbi:MarR family transcriptional regulator [Niveispirillum irakense]|uniref:MarR family transcriptional regulator n=1 Tax=Niveispirillum irakense TaxID=34011 RepID=UPI000A02AE6D|nr:MarR family transcriptional regulator [Niveispirillum irakense]
MIRLPRLAERTAGTGDGAGNQAVTSEVALYRDIARVIDHMQRRLHDVVRVELGRVGVDDISPMQVLMLLNIGEDELSVRDLMERGYYLGSNASYNLKHLVEQGYVDRAASQRDRRAARLRLSEKGQWLCTQIGKLEDRHATQLLRGPADAADLETTYRMLRRLERMWGDVVRYDSRGQD